MDVEDYDGQEGKTMPETAETVENLDLLHYLRATFGKLHGPVAERAGHRERLREALAFLESLAFEGTADEIRRQEAEINSESLDTYSKFTLACDFCLEEHIFPLFGGLRDFDKPRPVTREHFGGLREFYTSCDNYCDLPPRSEMVNFWIGVCKGQHSKRIAGQGLPRNVYVSGLSRALNRGTSAAVKYFMDRAGEEVNRYVQEKPLAACHKAFSDVTFLRYCLLFERMNDNQQLCEFGNFSYKALRYLCYLPKQLPEQHFLEAARLLLDHIPDDSYWEIMTFILDAATSNKKDPYYESLGKVKRATDEHADKICSYQRLFTGFWEVGAGRGRNASINQKGRHDLVYTVLLMDDKRVREMVFEEISPELKEDLLMGSLGVRRRNFCIKWAHRREVQMLERFFRGCTRHRKELLVEFRDAAVAMSPELVGRIWAYEFGFYIKEGQWQVLLDVLLEVVDKIIADRPDTGRLASLSID